MKYYEVLGLASSQCVSRPRSNCQRVPETDTDATALGVGGKPRGCVAGVEQCLSHFGVGHGLHSGLQCFGASIDESVKSSYPL